MQMRQITVIVQDILGAGDTPQTRRVAACGILRNPLADAPRSADLSGLVDMSVTAGEILTRRALAALDGMAPRGYGKAAIVGGRGDLEHGAAMIHVRLGLPMRRLAGGGPALIPGTAKVAGMGAAVDIIFGGLEDSWDYDAMDTMTIAVPDAPRDDEIVLAVAFLGGTRPNARIKGNPPEAVADLIARMRDGAAA